MNSSFNLFTLNIWINLNSSYRMPNISHYNHLLSLLIFIIFSWLYLFSRPSYRWYMGLQFCSWALLICFLFSYLLHLNGTHSIPNELHKRGVNVNFSRFTSMNRMYEQHLISLRERVAWIIHSRHSAELGKENSIIQEECLLCFKH